MPYQTFVLLSIFCRLINLLSPYQSFVVLSKFCYVLFTLSTVHVLALHHTHTKLWLRCKNISSSPSPTKQAASSQYPAFWFVLQLWPPLIVSGTVESYSISLSILLFLSILLARLSACPFWVMISTTLISDFDFPGLWQLNQSNKSCLLPSAGHLHVSPKTAAEYFLLLHYASSSTMGPSHHI